jgi:hypothetical protein
LADDGSGSDISIPSFLMFKNDADLIKDELKKGDHPVLVEMKWSLPTLNDRVEYHVWTVPEGDVSKEFFTNFKKLAIALGSSAYFTPHMYIYDGTRSQCQEQDGANVCYGLCTNGGRYCATDPVNGEPFLSAADVVTESLRRLCIWDHYGVLDGIGVEWWNYVEEFHFFCRDHGGFYSGTCIQDAYKHAGVDGERIRRCMIDSGGVDRDGPNNRLDNEIKSQTSRGVVIIPTAVVNAASIRKALTSTSVFHAICAGFSERTKPDICKKCGNCPNAVSCVEHGNCRTTYPEWSQGGGSTS